MCMYGTFSAQREGGYICKCITFYSSFCTAVCFFVEVVFVPFFVCVLRVLYMVVQSALPPLVSTITILYLEVIINFYTNNFVP